MFQIINIQQIIYPKKYEQYVSKYAELYNVDELLIYSIIKAESNFDEKANSKAKAIGLMQLMENTATEISNEIDNIEIPQEQIYEPETNIKLGTYYFSVLMNKYNNIGLALAAYNAGMGRVDGWIKDGILKKDGSDLENIPFKETNLYVRKILYNYEKYKKAMANPTKDTISMLFPINLEYPKEEFLIIKEHMDFIKSLGIDIEEFGMNSFIVKAHPTWFKEGLEEVFIRNCLEKIITMNKNFDLERFNDSISAMMACKASIKAGDPISMEEMKTLIERLKKCENPFNCAHGRPTIIHYPKYELDKLFKRAV